MTGNRFGALTAPLRRPAAGAAALLLSALPLLAGCGGDDNGDSRFSIGGRGLNQAVDSVRTERQRTSTSGPGGRAEADTRPDLPTAIRAALDSGNAAYRAGDYRAALEHFESITAEHPDVGAAWFGVFMAHRGLGNSAAADSAMRRAGVGDPDAMRLHGREADSAEGG